MAKFLFAFVVVGVAAVAAIPQEHYGTNYNAGDSGRSETINPDGSVQGQYAYTDPSGKLITVKYRAGKDGFQVEGDHLPKAPGAAPQHPQQQAPAQNNGQGYNPFLNNDALPTHPPSLYQNHAAQERAIQQQQGGVPQYQQPAAPQYQQPAPQYQPAPQHHAPQNHDQGYNPLVNNDAAPTHPPSLYQNHAAQERAVQQQQQGVPQYQQPAPQYQQPAAPQYQPAPQHHAPQNHGYNPLVNNDAAPTHPPSLYQNHAAQERAVQQQAGAPAHAPAAQAYNPFHNPDTQNYNPFHNPHVPDHLYQQHQQQRSNNYHPNAIPAPQQKSFNPFNF